ncbi:FAD-binding oxidoreductase [Salinactinospora qingdaonensis]|uniref:FAD-binding oxidoreductase n=1 Tax=Salinactinospora qingdaonensis TaxID=702744 RepID=A0ABP7FLE9_9ACTN
MTDIRTGSGPHTASGDRNARARAELSSSFTGTVLLPEDPAYHQARGIFNAMIDRRPAVIAQCETTQDVVKAIGFARDQGLQIAVRGGGHGVAGTALVQDGLVIDLRRMNQVSVDLDTYTARVGGGATMSDLDRGTQPYHLMTTGGRVSTTGVAGFTLGGGTGWLDRKFGLACDNLLSVELVTADGELVRASEHENPELFWALHGGGGNFGVATSLTFALHELPAVTAAMLIWPPERGREVTRAYRDFIDTAPDDIGGGILYHTGLAEEFMPERLVGALALGMLVTYTGPEEEAREVIQPLRDLAPEGEMIAELPYADLQCMLDDPPSYRNYWTAEHIASLPDEAVDRYCATAEDMLVPSPTQDALLPMGGAVARAATDYPLPWRGSPWVVHPLAMWEDPTDDDAARRWVHRIRADMQPWSFGAVYLNFIGDEGEARVIAGFGADNYARLAAVKARYDPENVFHFNHNIKPG